MADSRLFLLKEIDAFLRASGMGEAYFGALAANNSKLVGRLRKGGSIQIETLERVRNFIRTHGGRQRADKKPRTKPARKLHNRKAQ